MPKNEDYLRELEEIAAANGGLVRPEAVVEYARNPETALHSWFEWDDSKAAEKYRLHQARMRLRLVLTMHPKAEIKFRAVVSLKEDRYSGQGYRLTLDVMSESERREQLLLEALAEFRALEEKYRQYQELAEIFAAIERSEALLRRKRVRSQRKEKESRAVT
jgi:hypothetical protein